MRHSAARKRHGRRKASAGIRRRLLLVPAVLLCLVLGLPTGALAYWTAGGAGVANATSGDVLPATSVTAAQLPGAGSIRIEWVRSTSPAVTGYRVQRSTGGGAWVSACGGTTLSATTRTCDEPELAHESSHRFRVVAIKGGWTATSADTPAVIVDTSRPTVTVRVAQGQANPTNSSTQANPIRFVVEFSEPVTGFTAGGVRLSGTATAFGGITSVTPSVGPAAVYTVSVVGAIADGGTVVASVPANVAVDGAGNSNLASTSGDGSVTLDNVAPSKPSAPKLQSLLSVDTGISQTDNITNARSLVFDPAAPLPGNEPDVVTVRLYKASSDSAAGDLVGTATIPGNATTYSLQEGTVVAPASTGTWWYYVTVTDARSNTSAPSDRQMVVVDRAIPDAVSAIGHSTVPTGLLGLFPHNRIRGAVPTDAAQVTAHACGRFVNAECSSSAQTAVLADGQFVLEYPRGLLGLGGAMSVWITVLDTAGNKSTTVRYDIDS